ncbi:MAG: site-specific integrase [Phycisphaerales bacterium]|jgi:integrase|nr:site-specific integrase [Phycisphaerales bacterium]
MTAFYTPVWSYERYKLVRRPDTDRYYITWCPPGSRKLFRRSTRTSDAELAKRRLVAFADARRVPGRRGADEVTLREVLDRYVHEHLAGKARQDAISVARVVDEFAKREGLVHVASMTPAMQRAYVHWRRERARRTGRELSNGTINKDLEVLRAALRFAQREGMVAEVPGVRLVARPPARDRFLRVDEVERLLGACREPHLHLFVMLALHTLQRPGAVFDLRWSQVDLPAGRIDFNPPGRPRTRKRRPVVPITRTLAGVLERASREARCDAVIAYEGKPVRSVKRSFAAACQRAQLPGVTPYVLRHTGSTLLAGSGVPLWQISGMLGHSISRTTEIYAKHTPEYLAGARDGLEALFGGLERPGGNARSPRLIDRDRPSETPAQGGAS